MLASCFVLDWRMSLVAFGGAAGLLPVVRLTRRLKAGHHPVAAVARRIAEMCRRRSPASGWLQAFGMERWESGRLAEANDGWLRFMRRSLRFRSISSPLME